MNLNRIAAPVLSTLLCGSAAMAGENFFPYGYQTKTFSNGLKAIVVRTPTKGIISYFTIVGTGSRDEVEPGRSGFAHFFEHMMFRGTKKFPSQEYQRIVAGIGARANAFTSDDITAYHLTFGRDDLEKVVEIESDRFQNLDYDKREFQTEAGAIHGEYRIASTNPWFALQEKLQDLAYDAHTYKHTTMGFEADIKAMPQAYDYSRQFHRRFYRPENTTILIVGDVDPQKAFELIEKYYGAWSRGYEPPKVVAEPPQTAPRSGEVAFTSQTLPIVILAYKGDAFDPSNRDYAAVRLLAELAFGPQSELYKKLVLREQRVEMLSCDIPVNRDQPLFTVAATVKNTADIDLVRDEIRATLNSFKTTPVDPSRLEDLKRRERYDFLMNLDTTDKTASALARFIAVAGGIEDLEKLYAESAKVTPQDIMHAAEKYFTSARRTVIVLKGPAGQATGGAGKKVASGQWPVAGKKSQIPNPKSQISPAPRPSPLTPSNPQSPISNPSSVLLPLPNDPAIVFRIWFKAGSQNDPPGKEGLAAITAAMISEGATQANSYEQIIDKLFPLAAGYSAAVSSDMTVVSARVHKDNLDQFYPLLIDAIARPAFKQEDLDRIKAQTLNYLENTLRYANNEELGKAVLYTTIFAKTPYGHLTQGTIDSVRSITIDDVRDFYKKCYTRDDATLGLAGGYDESLLARLNADIASLPAGVPSAVALPKPVAIVGRHVTIVQKECSATAISLGFPIDVLRDQKDWYALAVANSWLGQHRNLNGRLFQTIREARGLNYGDYSYIEYFPNAAALLTPPVNVCRRRQIFEMWIRPVPHSAEQFALRAALRELKSLVDNGLTEQQFNEAREFLKKYSVHFAPTTSEQLGYAIDDRFYGIDGSHLEKLGSVLDALTLADVNRAIKRHLQYENMQIVFVTNDAEALKKSLAADSPSPIAYPTPKPESVLAEDREISVFPLKIDPKNIRVVPVADLFQK